MYDCRPLPGLKKRWAHFPAESRRSVFTFARWQGALRFVPEPVCDYVSRAAAPVSGMPSRPGFLRAVFRRARLVDAGGASVSRREGTEAEHTTRRPMNFLTERLLRNPYPLYRFMRKVAPVFHDPIHRLWMLFDFASVRTALGDPQTFSSRAAPPGGTPLDWLIFLDPPLHSKLRGLVMRSFTPQAISGLAPSIASRVEALLEDVRGRGEMDVVSDFAERLPLMVIADLIGLPSTDEARLRRWTDAILHLSDAIAGGDIAARAIAAFQQAAQEMRPYILDLVDQRRASPASDLLTRLVEAEVDGERLNDDDILGFFQLLLLAGSETTTNLIANAVVCLLQQPDVHRRLIAQPDLLSGLIEEVLRFRSPVQMVFRQTTREVTMHGKRIPPGALVLLMIGSANRDGRQYPLPDVFDISRAPSHIAFGHGAHFCIGAMLARLEVTIALPRLLALKNMRLAGANAWRPRAAVNVHGPSRLHVLFD